MQNYPLAILFSGNGGNMETLYRNLHHCVVDDSVRIEIPVVFTNNPDAYGIQRARRLGVHCEILSHKNFQSRQKYEEEIVRILKPYNPQICLLAGFMRILSEVFLQNFTAINIHPSILPLFKGARAIQESFDSNMKVAGVSIHYVTQELDSGEIIEQQAFHKKHYPTFESFEAKIHEIEHQIYPQTIINLIKKSKKAF